MRPKCTLDVDIEGPGGGGGQCGCHPVIRFSGVFQRRFFINTYRQFSLAVRICLRHISTYVWLKAVAK